MNVALSSMQRWVAQYRNEIKGITPQARAISPEQQRIQALEAQIKQLCAYASPSAARSHYYRRLVQKHIDVAVVKLNLAVRQIHTEMDATDGSRRMSIEINAQSFTVGRYKVRSLMKALSLKAKRPKQHHYLSQASPACWCPMH